MVANFPRETKMEDIYANPVVLKIHGGTPRGDRNLCSTCRQCQRTKGMNSGRETALCFASGSQPRRLSEPMVECSSYSDKRTPDLFSMKEIAWSLMTDKGGRKIGFLSPEQVRERTPSQVPIGF
jgi:hypothetical protein